MRRKRFILIFAGGVLWAVWLSRESISPPGSQPPPAALAERAVIKQPTALEKLLEGYGDPSTPPVEDLRKLHRAIAGYFSVVKDTSRFPIGGNADLAAALRGENANREVFVAGGHSVFSSDGLLIDRWDTPLVVHPEAWGRLELRTAGPDKTAYTDDDLVLTPDGIRPEGTPSLTR